MQAAIQELPNRSGASSGSSEKCQGSSVQAPRRRWPDFISVTRGPGMRSNLNTGLDTAKGLAVAWQVPLVAVNHMQAHALTPRLVSALRVARHEDPQPAFPFLSLLVSGGHSMLVYCQDLTNHRILASTTDIAVGDMLDKAARVIVPKEILDEATDTTYGALLERFVFGQGPGVPEYVPPATRTEELSRKTTRWGWSLGPPLAVTKAGRKSLAMEFSFSGLESAIKRRFVDGSQPVTVEERRMLGLEVMRVAFEHLASRVVLALGGLGGLGGALADGPSALVVSGGVASNSFLRHV